LRAARARAGTVLRLECSTDETSSVTARRLVASRLASLAVVPGYVLATIVLTWPLALVADRGLPTVLWEADALLQAFLLGWDWKALGGGVPGGVFALPIFHPETRALTFMDHLLGEAVLGWPVWAATRSIPLAYNFLVGLSFVACGWATYRLARHLGAGRAASWLAGFLFAFSPYRFCNLCDLNLLHAEFLIVGIWLALRWRARRRLRDLGVAGLALAVQSWFGWYYVLFLGFALALLVAWEIVAGRWTRRDTLHAVGAGVLVALLVLPSAWPYAAQRRAMPEYRRSLGQSVLYSADLLDYLKTNFHNRISSGMPWRTGDLAYWPGAVAILLAARGTRRSSVPRAQHRGGPWWRRIGAAASRAHPGTGYLALLGIVSFVLSLGPLLRLAGRTLPIPLPYAVLYFVVPGFDGMRAPGRFAMLVLLALAVLAALGLDRWRATQRGALRPMLVPLLLLVAVIEIWAVPIPIVAFPNLGAPPAAYAWLARQPRGSALLELPAPASHQDESEVHAARQVYVLAHGQPILDGVSGFAPPGVEALRKAVQDFPDATALLAAARRGARFVLVHYGELDSTGAARIRGRAALASGLVERAVFGDDVIYEVRVANARPPSRP
jgi:hypothetical protein